MDKRRHTPENERARRTPLFASPWMALFLIIRREWMASRS